MTDENRELREWLSQRGHSPADIEKIIERLTQYDSQTIRKSVFDSIYSGDFSFDDILNEAQGAENEPRKDGTS